MMNKLCFSLFILFGLLVLLPAQEVTFSVIYSNEKSISIRVDFPEPKFQKVNVDGSTMYKIVMKGAFPVEKLGAPEILNATKSIIIPDGATPVIQSVEIESKVIENFELAPSKGIFYRNQNPDSIPYVKGKEYQTDEFYPSKMVALNERYTLRDFDGISISCYPFSYNPVTKTLQQNNFLIIRIDFEDVPQRKKKQKEQRIVKEFVPIYNRHFLNFNSTNHTLTQEEEGDMLIICPADYVSALEPLKSWKIKNGIHTEIVTIESIGATSTAIKGYITNYYENNNLAFVLLVGNRNSMPPYYSAKYIQDNWYTEVAGNDNYPDLFLGRFLASSLADVAVQVEKTIAYESNPPETDHFPLFCGIASIEGPGHNDLYDWQHIHNIDNKLFDFTYTSGYELFDGSQDGLDASGNPTATMLSNVLNSGVSIINYAGHGNWDRFTTTSFYNYYVDMLTNYNKLPFIFSVACQNGNYNNSQACFAQRWLTANRDGQPTGAVAAVMSTIDQAWFPPMAGQEEMNNILIEANSQGIRKTFGAICFNAFLKMLDAYPSDYPHYTHEVYRTWLIFGDPSLMVRTAVPDRITATHPERIPDKTNSIAIQSDIEGAKIVLSCQNSILGKGYIENGTLTISYIDDISTGDTIHVVVSKFNHIPYQGIIIVGAATGIDDLQFTVDDLQIYPNPTTGKLIVEMCDMRLSDMRYPISDIRLFDMMGREISVGQSQIGKSDIGQSDIGIPQSKIVNLKSKIDIDISHLSAGIYILQVMDENRIIKNFKLIKN